MLGDGRGKPLLAVAVERRIRLVEQPDRCWCCCQPRQRKAAALSAIAASPYQARAASIAGPPAGMAAPRNAAQKASISRGVMAGFTPSRCPA
jgi:hypothetical protein